MTHEEFKELVDLAYKCMGPVREKMKEMDWSGEAEGMPYFYYTTSEVRENAYVFGKLKGASHKYYYDAAKFFDNGFEYKFDEGFDLDDM